MPARKNRSSVPAVPAAGRRPRQSWATRPLPPLTLEELDRHLDYIARLMKVAERRGEAHLCLPVWRRVVREREAFVANQAEIAAAVARLSDDTSHRQI